MSNQFKTFKHITVFSYNEWLVTCFTHYHSKLQVGRDIHKCMLTSEAMTQKAIGVIWHWLLSPKRIMLAITLVQASNPQILVHFVQGITHCVQIAAEILHHIFNTSGVFQNFNTLCVGIEVYWEGTGNWLCKVPHLFFGFFKTFWNKVDFLEGGNKAFL